MAQHTSFMDLGWSYKDFLQRCDDVYRIQHRETMRFHYLGELLRKNEEQQRLLKYIIQEIGKGGRRKIQIVKSRKIGASTISMALHHDIAAHCPGFQGACLSHTDEGVNIMHSLLEGLRARIPEVDRPDARLKAKSLVFDEPLPDDGVARIGESSAILFRTMRGFAPMSGATIRFVHFTEMGKLRLPRDKAAMLLTAVLNAIAPSGPSLVINESTAQGVGNLFHDLWLECEANAKNGRVPAEGEWAGFFSPAHRDRGNRQRIERGYNWMDWPRVDLVRENALVQEFNVDLEYLRWRRTKIKELGGDGFSRYNEEYPDRAADAFVSSSGGLIPQDDIDKSRVFIQRNPETFTWSMEQHDAPFGSDAVHFGG